MHLSSRHLCKQAAAMLLVASRTGPACGRTKPSTCHASPMPSAVTMTSWTIPTATTRSDGLPTSITLGPSPRPPQRPGQTLFVYRLICTGTVEEKIQAMPGRKTELARRDRRRLRQPAAALRRARPRGAVRAVIAGAFLNATTRFRGVNCRTRGARGGHPCRDRSAESP